MAQHIADDDTAVAAAVPHALRFEPSWHFHAVPAEQVEHCLRPRRRGGLDQPAAAWLHKHLVALGHEANDRSAHFLAHSWFECAYAMKERIPDLLSSVNMRLRLGQFTLAKHLYARVLSMELTDAEREVRCSPPPLPLNPSARRCRRALRALGALGIPPSTARACVSRWRSES